MAAVTGEYNGSFGDLEQSSNKMTERMREAIGRINSNAATLASSSEQLSASSETLASTVEEVSSQATGVAARAVGRAKATSEQVKHLETTSQEIGQVVKLITSDSQQAAGELSRMAGDLRGNWWASSASEHRRRVSARLRLAQTLPTIDRRPFRRAASVRRG
jgi:methyl-accepting chemotaxis protein